MGRHAWIALGLFALVSQGQPALAKEVTQRFEVKGMVCESCAKDIKAALGGKAGIHSVRVDLEKAIVTIAYEERRFRPEALIKAIDDYGFTARLLPRK